VVKEWHLTIGLTAVFGLELQMLKKLTNAK
jgi:hypothetical protein